MNYRIKPLSNGYVEVEKRETFLFFFSRWKRVATFGTVGEAWAYINANGG